MFADFVQINLTLKVDTRCFSDYFVDFLALRNAQITPSNQLYMMRIIEWEMREILFELTNDYFFKFYACVNKSFPNYVQIRTIQVNLERHLAQMQVVIKKQFANYKVFDILALTMEESFNHYKILHPMEHYGKQLVTFFNNAPLQKASFMHRSLSINYAISIALVYSIFGCIHEVDILMK